MEFQYYVVEFLTPVHSTVPRFVCIPKSWIRSPIMDKKAAISFPNEEYLATVEKIVLGQNYAQEWTIQMAEIKFGCDNLNETQKYALEQCIGVPNVTLEKNYHDLQSNKKSSKRSASVDGKTPQKGKKRKVEIPDDITQPKYFKPGDPPRQNEFKQKSEATHQKPNREHMIQQEKNEREMKILKKLSQVFETMRESFDEMTDTLDRMHDTVCVIKKTLNKTADMTNGLFNFDKNKQSATTESIAEKESRRSRQDSAEHPKSFVFPDNTDKSLKWTLRHQKLTNGLIELLSQSGVYARVSELERLDTEANNPNQAALLLMKEIFSDKALSICSLTGRGNREALDNYSRKVLIMYLNEYCNKRRWKTDEPSVWMFLRSKLPEFRTNEESRNQ